VSLTSALIALHVAPQASKISNRPLAPPGEASSRNFLIAFNFKGVDSMTLRFTVFVVVVVALYVIFLRYIKK
jgi:hypothetical protein